MKKFYFLFIAMMVGFVANAADYYLIGGFNGWSLKDANCKFTDAGDGTFVLDYNGTLTSGFKINDGTWGAVDFGGSTTLKLGEEYKLVSKGGNIPLVGNIEKPHIVLNPTAQTLLITGQEVEASLKYGIHGQIFGNTAWETVDLKANENGTWTYTANVVPGDFGIKVMDAASGSQTDWFSSADEDATITADKIGATLNVKAEGKNWSSTITGNITFTFDPKAMTLTLSGEGSSTPIPSGAPESLYIIGNINTGDWNPGTALPLAKDGDIFTAEQIEIHAADGAELGYFSFLTTTGGSWDDVNAKDRFGAATADELVADGGSATVVRYAAPSASGGAHSWSVAPGVYTVKVDFSTMTLTMVKTGEVGGNFLPAKLSITGSLVGGGSVEMSKDENVFTIEDVEIGINEYNNDDKTHGCFNFISYDENGKYGPTYGSLNDYDMVASEQTVRIYRYDGLPEYLYARAWSVDPGKYSIIVDFTSMTMYVEKTGELGVEGIAVDDAPATYYNLQGVKVVNPQNGIYVKRQGDKVNKIVIR